MEQLALEPHAREAAALLATPSFAHLMGRLNALFVDGQLMGKTPEETAFNLGQREVVIYLRRLAALKERTGEDHG